MQNYPCLQNKLPGFFKTFITGVLIASLIADPVVFAAVNESRLSSEVTVKIPEKLGWVEEVSKGTSGKTIFYIQDAHDSLEAQKNIAALIDLFVKENGVKTVYEEGYEGPVPTDSYFGFIADAKIREKVSYFLLDKLRLRAAEYAHINRKEPFKLIGADSIKLHLENIAQYRKTAKSQKQIASDLESLSRELEAVRSLNFSKEFKEWMKLKERYENHELPLLDYLKRTAVSLRAERSNLRTEIASSAPPPRNDAMSNFPYLTLLLSAEKTKNETLVNRIKAADTKDFFRETDRLEDAVAEHFLDNEEDRKTYHYDKTIHLLKRLGEMKVTSAEFEAVKDSLKSFNTQAFAEFIAQKLHKPVLLSRRWETAILNSIRFYELAEARNQALAQSLEDFMKNPEEKTAVLVFGGFHKEDILEIFQRKEISYAVITPKISSPDPVHEKYYRQLMGVGHHDFEIPLAVRTGVPAEAVFQIPYGRDEIQTVYQGVLANNADSADWMQSVERQFSKKKSRAENRPSEEWRRRIYTPLTYDALTRMTDQADLRLVSPEFSFEEKIDALLRGGRFLEINGQEYLISFNAVGWHIFNSGVGNLNRTYDGLVEGSITKFILKKILDRAQQGGSFSVLEWGAGMGKILQGLARRAKSPSIKWFGFGRDFSRKWKYLSPEIKMILDDAPNFKKYFLPGGIFQDHRPDIVFSHYGLEHILSQSPGYLFEDIYPALADDGIVIFRRGQFTGENPSRLSALPNYYHILHMDADAGYMRFVLQKKILTQRTESRESRLMAMSPQHFFERFIPESVFQHSSKQTWFSSGRVLFNPGSEKIPKGFDGYAFTTDFQEKDTIGRIQFSLERFHEGNSEKVMSGVLGEDKRWNALVIGIGEASKKISFNFTDWVQTTLKPQAEALQFRYITVTPRESSLGGNGRYETILKNAGFEPPEEIAGLWKIRIGSPEAQRDEMRTGTRTKSSREKTAQKNEKEIMQFAEKWLQNLSAEEKSVAVVHDLWKGIYRDYLARKLTYRVGNSRRPLSGAQKKVRITAVKEKILNFFRKQGFSKELKKVQSPEVISAGLRKFAKQNPRLQRRLNRAAGARSGSHGGTVIHFESPGIRLNLPSDYTKGVSVSVLRSERPSQIVMLQDEEAPENSIVFQLFKNQIWLAHLSEKRLHRLKSLPDHKDVFWENDPSFRKFDAQVRKAEKIILPAANRTLGFANLAIYLSDRQAHQLQARRKDGNRYRQSEELIFEVVDRALPRPILKLQSLPKYPYSFLIEGLNWRRLGEEKKQPLIIAKKGDGARKTSVNLNRVIDMIRTGELQKQLKLQNAELVLDPGLLRLAEIAPPEYQTVSGNHEHLHNLRVSHYEIGSAADSENPLRLYPAGTIVGAPSQKNPLPRAEMRLETAAAAPMPDLNEETFRRLSQWFLSHGEGLQRVKPFYARDLFGVLFPGRNDLKVIDLGNEHPQEPNFIQILFRNFPDFIKTAHAVAVKNWIRLVLLEVERNVPGIPPSYRTIQEWKNSEEFIAGLSEKQFYGQYDAVMINAPQGNVPAYFEEAKKMLKPGGAVFLRFHRQNLRDGRIWLQKHAEKEGWRFIELSQSLADYPDSRDVSESEPLFVLVRSEMRISKKMKVLNGLSGEELSDGLKKMYRAGFLTWQSQWMFWNYARNKDRVRSAGIFVLRKRGKRWHFLLARKKGEKEFSIPAGRINAAPDSDYEYRADFENLQYLNLAVLTDAPEGRETVPAGALRELQEETGIDGRISGRLNDDWDAGKRKLTHFFIHVDGSSPQEISPLDKELEEFRWVPVRALLKSKTGQEIRSIGSAVKAPLAPILRKGSLKQLRRILLKVTEEKMSRSESRGGSGTYSVRYDIRLGKKESRLEIKEQLFEGNLLIHAGQEVYRVWVDAGTQKVHFKRIPIHGGQSGSADKILDFDQKLTVGRTSGDFVNASAPALSGLHFGFQITEKDGRHFFTVRDLGNDGKGSSHGTRIVWFEEKEGEEPSEPHESYGNFLRDAKQFLSSQTPFERKFGKKQNHEFKKVMQAASLLRSLEDLEQDAVSSAFDLDEFMRENFGVTTEQMKTFLKGYYESGMQAREALKSYASSGSLFLAERFQMNVFLVENPQGGKFVLKVPAYRKIEELAEWEAAYSAHLKQDGVLASGMIRNDQGRYITVHNKTPYALFEYAEGGGFSWGEVHGEYLTKAGETLAQMHDSGKNSVFPGRPYTLREMPQHMPLYHTANGIRRLQKYHREMQKRGPPFTESEQYLSAHFNDLKPHFRKIREYLSPETVQSLPQTIAHGDYHQGNIRFAQDGTVRIFDLEQAHPDARLYDLANAFILDPQQDGTSLRLNKVETFLTAYQKRTAVPLTSQELALLPEVFRAWYVRIILLNMEQFPDSGSRAVTEQFANLAVLDSLDWAGLAQRLSLLRAESRHDEERLPVIISSEKIEAQNYPAWLKKEIQGMRNSLIKIKKSIEGWMRDPYWAHTGAKNIYDGKMLQDLIRAVDAFSVSVSMNDLLEAKGLSNDFLMNLHKAFKQFTGNAKSEIGKRKTGSAAQKDLKDFIETNRVFGAAFDRGENAFITHSGALYLYLRLQDPEVRRIVENNIHAHAGRKIALKKAKVTMTEIRAVIEDVLKRQMKQLLKDGDKDEWAVTGEVREFFLAPWRDAEFARQSAPRITIADDARALESIQEKFKTSSEVVPADAETLIEIANRSFADPVRERFMNRRKAYEILNRIRGKLPEDFLLRRADHFHRAAIYAKAAGHHYYIYDQRTESGNQQILAALRRTHGQEILPVGNTDSHDHGLTLLTDDPEASVFLLRGQNLSETYRVEAAGRFSQSMADRLTQGFDHVIKTSTGGHKTIHLKAKVEIENASDAASVLLVEIPEHSEVSVHQLLNLIRVPVRNRTRIQLGPVTSAMSLPKPEQSLFLEGAALEAFLEAKEDRKESLRKLAEEDPHELADLYSVLLRRVPAARPFIENEWMNFFPMKEVRREIVREVLRLFYSGDEGIAASAWTMLFHWREQKPVELTETLLEILKERVWKIHPDFIKSPQQWFLNVSEEAAKKTAAKTILPQLFQEIEKASKLTEPLKLTLPQPEGSVYYVLYKPRYVLSSRRENANDRRLTVFDMFEQQTGLSSENLYAAGRLDFDVDGLVILTNDGAFNSVLMPFSHVEKKYEVSFPGLFTEAQAQRLREGVIIETKNAAGENMNYHTHPARVEIQSSSFEGSTVYLYISEGKFHQVKEMFRTVGVPQIRLRRLAVGVLDLSELNLARGAGRILQGEELDKVRGMIAHAENILEKGIAQSERKIGWVMPFFPIYFGREKAVMEYAGKKLSAWLLMPDLQARILFELFLKFQNGSQEEVTRLQALLAFLKEHDSAAVERFQAYLHDLYDYPMEPGKETSVPEMTAFILKNKETLFQISPARERFLDYFRLRKPAVKPAHTAVKDSNFSLAMAQMILGIPVLAARVHAQSASNPKDAALAARANQLNERVLAAIGLLIQSGKAKFLENQARHFSQQIQTFAEDGNAEAVGRLKMYEDKIKSFLETAGRIENTREVVLSPEKRLILSGAFTGSKSGSSIEILWENNQLKISSKGPLLIAPRDLWLQPLEQPEQRTSFVTAEGNYDWAVINGYMERRLLSGKNQYLGEPRTGKISIFNITSREELLLRIHVLPDNSGKSQQVIIQWDLNEPAAARMESQLLNVIGSGAYAEEKWSGHLRDYGRLVWDAFAEERVPGEPETFRDGDEFFTRLQVEEIIRQFILKTDAYTERGPVTAKITRQFTLWRNHDGLKDDRKNVWRQILKTVRAESREEELFNADRIVRVLGYENGLPDLQNSLRKSSPEGVAVDLARKAQKLSPEIQDFIHHFVFKAEEVSVQTLAEPKLEGVRSLVYSEPYEALRLLFQYGLVFLSRRNHLSRWMGWAANHFAGNPLTKLAWNAVSDRVPANPLNPNVLLAKALNPKWILGIGHILGFEEELDRRLSILESSEPVRHRVISYKSDRAAMNSLMKQTEVVVDGQTYWDPSKDLLMIYHLPYRFLSTEWDEMIRPHRAEFQRRIQAAEFEARRLIASGHPSWIQTLEAWPQKSVLNQWPDSKAIQFKQESFITRYVANSLKSFALRVGEPYLKEAVIQYRAIQNLSPEDYADLAAHWDGEEAMRTEASRPFSDPEKIKAKAKKNVESKREKLKQQIAALKKEIEDFKQAESFDGISRDAGWLAIQEARLEELETSLPIQDQIFQSLIAAPLKALWAGLEEEIISPDQSRRLLLDGLQIRRGENREISAGDLKAWILRTEQMVGQETADAVLDAFNDEIKAKLKADEEAFLNDAFGRSIAAGVRKKLAPEDKSWVYTFVTLAAAVLSSHNPALEDLRRLDSVIERWNKKDNPQRWNFSLTLFMQLATNSAVQGDELKAMMRLAGKGIRLPGEYKYKMAAFSLFLLGMHVRSSFLDSTGYDEISADFNPKRSLNLAVETLRSQSFAEDVPENLRAELLLALKVGLTHYVFSSARAWIQPPNLFSKTLMGKAIAPQDLPKILPLQNFIAVHRDLLVTTVEEIKAKSKASGFSYLGAGIPWLFKNILSPVSFETAPPVSWDRILMNAFDTVYRPYYFEFMLADHKNSEHWNPANNAVLLSGAVEKHAFTDRTELLYADLIKNIREFRAESRSFGSPGWVTSEIENFRNRLETPGEDLAALRGEIQTFQTELFHFWKGKKRDEAAEESLQALSDLITRIQEKIKASAHDRPVRISYSLEFLRILPELERTNPGIQKKIERILTTSFSRLKKGTDYDEVSGGRSVLLKLTHPYPAGRKPLAVIKIKGVQFEAGQWAIYDPVEEMRRAGFAMPDGPIQPQDSFFTPEGFFAPVNKPNYYQGRQRLKGSETEADISLQAALKGLDVPFSIGSAEFLSEISPDGQKMGAVLLGLPGFEGDDFKTTGITITEAATKHINGLRRFAENHKLNNEYEAFEETVIQILAHQGANLKMFHRKGFFHDNFHLGNSAYYQTGNDMRMQIQDLERARSWKGMTPAQALGYLVWDLRQSLRAISRLRQVPGTIYAHLPIPYERIFLAGYFTGIDPAFIPDISIDQIQMILAEATRTPTDQIDHPLIHMLRANFQQELEALRAENRQLKARRKEHKFEKQRIFIDFEDLKKFSDSQIKEIVSVSKTNRYNAGVVIYNLDPLDSLGKFFRSKQTKHFKAEMLSFEEAAKKYTEGFSGGIIHLSKTAAVKADTLKRQLSEAAGRRFYALSYQDDSAGTLGVGLRDLSEGKLRKDSMTDKLTKPVYMGLDGQGKLFIADPEQAGVSIFQAAYARAYAFARAA